MFSRVLTVCTGNICRSPMAEYLLRAFWQKPGVHVASAGVGALVNHPADPQGMSVMARHDIDMSEHRARQMNGAMAEQSDLILVMEPGHAQWLFKNYPATRGRVYSMTEWLPEAEVPDPYQRGEEAFVRCFSLLDRAVASWLERL